MKIDIGIGCRNLGRQYSLSLENNVPVIVYNILVYLCDVCDFIFQCRFEINSLHVQSTKACENRFAVFDFPRCPVNLTCSVVCRRDIGLAIIIFWLLKANSLYNVYKDMHFFY